MDRAARAPADRDGARRLAVFRTALRRDQRPRDRRFRFGANAPLVMGDEAAGEHNANHRGDQRGDPDRARVVLEGVAESIAACAEDRRPDEAAERIEQQEARPGEMVDAG